MGHRLKDETGNILCPRLRKHVCPTCQATGDKAHTQKYCPRRMKPIWKAIRQRQYTYLHSIQTTENKNICKFRFLK